MGLDKSYLSGIGMPLQHAPIFHLGSEIWDLIISFDQFSLAITSYACFLRTYMYTPFQILISLALNLYSEIWSSLTIVFLQKGYGNHREAITWSCCIQILGWFYYFIPRGNFFCISWKISFKCRFWSRKNIKIKEIFRNYFN